MLLTPSVCRVSGTYRSNCCGVVRDVPAFQKFPPCDRGIPGVCNGPNVIWTLVRRTQIASERWVMPNRVV